MTKTKQVKELTHGIIEVPIPEAIIKKAYKRSEEMGVLRNSITKGAGNVAGFIGELVVLKYFGGELADTKDFDILKDDIKYEVKTKRCKAEPEAHYECSVATYSQHQDCDVYVFVRVTNDFSKAWILGYLENEHFYRIAEYMPKGKIDPSNGFRVRTSCYNVPIFALNKFKKKSKQRIKT